MSASSTKRLGFLRRINRRPLLRIGLIAFGVWFVFAFGLGVAVYVYGQTDHALPSDVIIVLGAGINRNGTPSAGMLRRATRGAELWQAGYATTIICSGGFPTWSNERSEAESCAEVLQANGVPADAIVLEGHSRSTEENALYSHEIMRERGWSTALVVSDSFHLLRASWIFSAEGITATFSPASEQAPFFNMLYSVGREVVALHWQAFKMIFNLPVTFVPYL